MSIRHLDALLEPRSIVVVGASDRPGSVGATVWRNLRSGGFQGAIRALNPAHRTLDGEHVFARCADLPVTPDLAVLCVPPEAVVDTLAELGRTGTRAAIVMTAGIDARTEGRMLDVCRPHLLRVLGPNCIGMLCPHLGLNASFAHTDALPGDLAFVTQSGALMTAVLDWSKSRRIGFSHLVSLGDHLDVDAGDMLDYLASDARTRAILMYLESVESPRKFMSAARAAARNKPVIVVKAGRAGEGPKAATSHSGALAGSDIVIDAAIRRAGLLRVDTLDELFLAAETLARFRGSAEGGLTVMTNGGGAGVIAADAAARAGIALAVPSRGLLSTLSAKLPATWSRANPVDIIGDAPVTRYVETLRALLDDPGTGTLLFMHAPTAIVRSDDIAHACVPLLRDARDRVMACWLGDGAVAEARRIFEDAGIACYATPEEAVRAFQMLATYRRNQALLLEAPTASESPVPDVAAAREIVDAALAEGRETLDAAASLRLLAAYGIPVVPTRRCAGTAEAAVAAADALGYPVALKVLSPALSHKTDAGGVDLNLRDAPSVHDAAIAMLARVHERQPAARVEGFAVQAMAQRPRGRELLVGASLDLTFGPVVMFGEGGTAVEVLADRAVALPPLNRVLARELVSRTRVARLLAGWRDHPPVDLDALCDVLVAVARMLADLPELRELDINPLIADDQGVVAIDARMRLAAAGPSAKGADRFAIRPYPAELARSVAWAGRRLELRPVRPEDLPLYEAFIDGVAAEDLRLRFFTTRRELPSSELARSVQIDYAREMAFVAVDRQADGLPAILGAVQAVCDPDNVDAEFAILVRSDLKAHGLGRLLLDRMIEHLRSNGTQRLVGDVLQENATMRSLVHDCGFAVAPNGHEPGAIRYVLELRGAAPASTEPPQELAATR
jgi:acetyltransferase